MLKAKSKRGRKCLFGAKEKTWEEMQWNGNLVCLFEFYFKTTEHDKFCSFTNIYRYRPIPTDTDRHKDDCKWIRIIKKHGPFK